MNPSKAAAQTPSICRMVVYHGHGHPVPEQWPAVVQAVNPDGSLKLFVFGGRGHSLIERSIEGEGVNEWSWPARENENKAVSSKAPSGDSAAGQTSPPPPVAQT
jgi:hypothetical protein